MKKMLCLVLVLLTAFSSCVFASAESDLDTAVWYFENGYYKQAEQIFLLLAEYGDLDAHAYLVTIYDNRLTGTKNAAENTVYWVRRTKLLMEDYYSYAHELEKAKDYEGFVNILVYLACFDHLDALNDLSVCLINGTGIEKDYSFAYTLLQRAAAMEHPVSVYNMGVFYEEGYYVEKNIKTALGYYKKAAELGNKSAAAAASRVEKSLNANTPSVNKDSFFYVDPHSTSPSTGNNSFFYVDPHTPASPFAPNCPICNDTAVCGACGGLKDFYAGWGETVTCFGCKGNGKCPYCKYYH